MPAPERQPTSTTTLGFALVAGFTLLELLIVLSIMAAIAIMAWPRILPALGRSVPRTAALQLKRDLAEAREEAIRAGETWVFRYQVDSPYYQLAPASWQESAHDSRAEFAGDTPSENEINEPPPVEQDDREVATRNVLTQPTQSDSTSPLTTAQKPSKGQNAQRSPLRHYESRELPGDVVFLEPAPPWEEGLELRTEEELRKEEGELLVAEDAQLSITPDAPRMEQVPWITGSEFYADGRARDCELELHPRDSQHFIRVRLRGFTGALAIGPVERKQEFPASSSEGTTETATETGQADRSDPSHSQGSQDATSASPKPPSRGKS